MDNRQLRSQTGQPQPDSRDQRIAELEAQLAHAQAVIVTLARYSAQLQQELAELREQIAQLQQRAAELGIVLLEANVNTSADVKQAAQSVVARGADAIVDGADNIASSAIDAVIGVAESSSLPFITVYPNLAERGALIAQGWNYVENGRKTAAVAARVLEGEDPAEIPFQTLDVKKLIVNETAARRLGLTIPPELLSWAEDVIR